MYRNARCYFFFVSRVVQSDFYCGNVSVKRTAGCLVTRKDHDVHVSENEIYRMNNLSRGRKWRRSEEKARRTSRLITGITWIIPLHLCHFARLLRY